MTFAQRTALAVATAASTLLLAGGPATVEAAESASGAYVLGIRGPGAGITPPEGLFFSNQIYVYDGEISGRLPLEGGRIPARAQVSPIVNIPTLLWITPVTLGDARLGVSLTAPFGQVSVEGTLGPLRVEDDIFSFADPSVAVFLGGRIENVHWQAGVTTFLPIGDYRVGDLANISKNRLAFDVYGALTWLEPTLGLDVTNVVGFTFNQENEATDYRTGTEFHWEWAVSKKFENGLSVGGVGYYYNQIGEDEGRGARLGAFKGEALAIGATLGYDFKAGQIPISTRIRYYHELRTENRLEGDAVFVSVSMPLWVPGAGAR
jgi:hypothetical protein